MRYKQTIQVARSIADFEIVLQRTEEGYLSAPWNWKYTEGRKYIPRGLGGKIVIGTYGVPSK